MSSVNVTNDNNVEVQGSDDFTSTSTTNNVNSNDDIESRINMDTAESDKSFGIQDSSINSPDNFRITGERYQSDSDNINSLQLTPLSLSSSHDVDVLKDNVEMGGQDELFNPLTSVLLNSHTEAVGHGSKIITSLSHYVSNDRYSMNSTNTYMTENMEVHAFNIKGTVVSMLVTMIGVAIVNTPFIFLKAGLVGGLFLFIVVPCLSLFGIFLLQDAAEHTMLIDYCDIVKEVFSNSKVVSFIIGAIANLFIILNCIGTHLLYLHILVVCFSSSFNLWGCTSLICDHTLLTIILVLSIVLPLSLMRDFKRFWYTIYLSAMALISIIALAIICSPIEHNKHKTENKFLENPKNLFTDVGLALSTGSVIYIFNMAPASQTLYKSMLFEHQSPKTYKNILIAAFVICAIVCIITGSVGFYSFQENTQSDILVNFNSFGEGYTAFSIVFGCHLLLCIPLNFYHLRYNFIKLFLRYNPLEMDWLPNAIITFLILTFMTIVLLVLSIPTLGFQGGVFNAVTTITGSVVGCIINFVLPGFMYVKIHGIASLKGKGALALAILGIIIPVVFINYFTILK